MFFSFFNLYIKIFYKFALITICYTVFYVFALTTEHPLHWYNSWRAESRNGFVLPRDCNRARVCLHGFSLDYMQNNPDMFFEKGKGHVRWDYIRMWLHKDKPESCCFLFLIQRFSFNLITGLTTNDDIAFHFNPRINDSVVQNSRRNGSWENEERTSGCPISSGSAFDIFIVTNSEGYVVWRINKKQTHNCKTNKFIGITYLLLPGICKWSVELPFQTPHANGESG